MVTGARDNWRGLPVWEAFGWIARSGRFFGILRSEPLPRNWRKLTWQITSKLLRLGLASVNVVFHVSGLGILHISKAIVETARVGRIYIASPNAKTIHNIPIRQKPLPFLPRL